MKETLADSINAPSDPSALHSWSKLSNSSKFALLRALERADIAHTDYKYGFSYLLLQRISRENLLDARNVGAKKAETLLDELRKVFVNYDKPIDFHSSSSGKASDVVPKDDGQLSANQQDHQIRDLNHMEVMVFKAIKETNTEVIKHILIEQEMEDYLKRIGSHELLNGRIKRLLLRKFQPKNQSLRRAGQHQDSQDSAMLHLLDTNLRLAFAVAKQQCKEAEIRGRVLAGNLGLLVALHEMDYSESENLEVKLMESIRRHILYFIQFLGLSYDEILAQYVINVAPQTGEIPSNDLGGALGISFEELESVDQIVHRIEEFLLQLPNFDERALDVLKKRNEAFGSKIHTLDEIGKAWGITRERVRQIASKQSDLRIPIGKTPPVLEKAVQLLVNSKDQESFEQMAQEQLQEGGLQITPRQLRALCELLCLNSLVSKIDSTIERMDREQGQKVSLLQRVRQFRSAIGIIDMEVLKKKLSIDESRARQLVLHWYPRTLFSGSIALARTQKLDTMFENSIRKQLMVKSPLSVEFLLEGLQRTARNRKTVLIGSVKDLTELIEVVAGDPPTFGIIQDSLIEGASLQKAEKWLVDVFNSTEFGILHSSEITDMALRDGVNVSSVQVYLSNSPIIRSHGDAVFSLVGTVVDPELLKSYSQINRDKMENSKIEFEFAEDDQAILRVKPNLNVITSGIVFPPAEVKAVFIGYEFITSCDCGSLNTIQKVKFTKSGFWTGFTAMIRHGFSQHNFKRDSIFTFHFDFRKMEVKLIS